MALGEELRRLRRTRNLSLRALEKRTGISNAYLSQIETRHVLNPSPHVLRKLAAALEIPYEELLAAAGYVDTQYPLPPRIAAMLGGVRLTDDQESELAAFVRKLVGSNDSEI